MHVLMRLFKNPISILYAGLLFFIILIIIYLSFSSLKNNPSSQIKSTITATPAPTTQSITPREAQTSDVVLSQTEQHYPQAKPQTFPNRDTSQTGTLVVETDPENVNVVLDELTGEEMVDYQIPYNTAPFKFVGIPVGTYAISAAKEGYDYTSVNFAIEKDKITRVKIQLTPISSEQ